VAVVVDRGERAGPRVEDLDGIGSRADLRSQVRNDDVDERLHQAVPRRRLAEHQRLRPRVVP
jgi:hypothetical protein